MTRTRLQRWKDVARFRPRDWRVLAEAALLLPALDVAARVVPPARLLAWASRRPPCAKGTLSEPAIRRIVWIVGIASNHHLVHMRCLARSLTLARVLGRRGIATEIRLGVRRQDGHLRAHAWVEFRGRPLNDTERVHERYAAFDQLRYNSAR
jgi:hypothetical protein